MTFGSEQRAEDLRGVVEKPMTKTMQLLSISAALAMPCAASTVLISSDGVGESYSTSTGATGVPVSIAREPVWAADANWESFAQTGRNGIVVPNGFAATFSKTFFFDGTVIAGELDIWADDTASVWADGMFAASTEPGRGSFIPGSQLRLSLTGWTAGYHTVSTLVTQTGLATFGFAMEGQAVTENAPPTPNVPEPGTSWMLGGSLIGFGLLGSRLRRLISPPMSAGGEGK